MSRGSDCWRHGGVVSVATALAACSLGGVTRDECTSNRQCAAAFGLGSVCAAEHLCSAPRSDPRCRPPESGDQYFPGDLFDDPVKHRDTILLGALVDFANTTQQARYDAVRLAIRQINEESGAEGPSFGLVSCNIAEPSAPSSGGLNAAVAAADYLTTALEVPALLGPASSADVAAVFQQVYPRGTFVISPSATSPALTRIDEDDATDERPGLLWRTAPSDFIQGKAIADDMLERNVEKIAVIAQMGAYGEGLYAVFQDHLGFFVYHRAFGNGTQFARALADVAAGDAREVLFIASAQDDVIAFLEAVAADPALQSRALFLTDSAATRDTTDRGPRALFDFIRGTRYSSPDAQDTVYGTFQANFLAEYGYDAMTYGFTAHAYDMAWVAALGAASARARGVEITGLEIARGARRLSSGQKLMLLPSNWNIALKHFRDGESIDVQGASGALDFQPDTEETSGTVELWHIDSSGAEPIIAKLPPRAPEPRSAP